MPAMSIAHLVLITQDEEPEIDEKENNTENKLELEATVTPAEPDQSDKSENTIDSDISHESNTDELLKTKDGGISKGLIVIIVACAIIVCAVAGIVLFVSKKKKNPVD